MLRIWPGAGKGWANLTFCGQWNCSAVDWGNKGWELSPIWASSQCCHFDQWQRDAQALLWKSTSFGDIWLHFLQWKALDSWILLHRKLRVCKYASIHQRWHDSHYNQWWNEQICGQSSQQFMIHCGTINFILLFTYLMKWMEQILSEWSCFVLSHLPDVLILKVLNLWKIY